MMRTSTQQGGSVGMADTAFDDFCPVVENIEPNEPFCFGNHDARFSVGLVPRLEIPCMDRGRVQRFGGSRGEPNRCHPGELCTSLMETRGK